MSSSDNNNPNQHQNHPISDSWVDLSGHCVNSGPQSPNRVTPVPFGGEQDYLRMLREAQRESNRSSTKVSPISSALMSLSSTRRNSPCTSPKSPPNSPNPECASFPEEIAGFYINANPYTGQLPRVHHESGGSAQLVTASELIWDWASRPNVPSTECPKSTSTSEASSSKDSEKEKSKKGFFYSKGVLYTLLLTNIFSLLLGAGLGMWIGRRGSSGNTIVAIGI